MLLGYIVTGNLSAMMRAAVQEHHWRFISPYPLEYEAIAGQRVRIVSRAAQLEGVPRGTPLFAVVAPNRLPARDRIRIDEMLRDHTIERRPMPGAPTA